MGKIVTFKPAAGPPRAVAPPGGPGAEILFFTGVRYERQSAAKPADGTRRRRVKMPVAKGSPNNNDKGRGRKKRA